VSVTLDHILSRIGPAELSGDASVSIDGASHDSRRIKPGWLFVAAPGAKSDGYVYVSDAIRAGAAAIIAEKRPTADAAGIAWITVPDARKVLSVIAALVHDEPTRRLVLVGVTGTNGKTTFTYLMEGIFRAAGWNPGVVGTVSYRWEGIERPAFHTTPEASDLQAIFDEMVHDGVTHSVIEASSHGLHLDRLGGCHFDVGVFTNLSQDHLDYHQDMESYYQAKRLLFTRLLPASSKTRASAVVNIDDPYGRRLAGEITGLPVISFGTSPDCATRPLESSISAAGISADIQSSLGPIPVRSKLTGAFNLLNILAAVAVASTLEIPRETVIRGIESVATIPGRLERVESPTGTIFVDYAHTPHALKNVLDALAGLRTGRIITIMGCGGDRDRSKRPKMGKEAAMGSDCLVVTSDNPRTEDPVAIITDVLHGVMDADLTLLDEDWRGDELPPRSYRVIPDRREAIRWALQYIEPNDILLIAGKGHETYQEINGARYPFDDRQVVSEELRA
jgi:UDP-N-acetylmuramoyl-L-alanyl-D-glutamate--2,6-diaminopimelate ligase